MQHIKACIFDLDGVIVDTAKYHYLAWRRLANSLGFDFTEEENEHLKGVSRMESLEIILHIGGKSLPTEEKLRLAALKNDWYVEFVGQMNEKEVLPGVEDLLLSLKRKGIKIALGSASKNAVSILERVKLIDYFDVIIDGNHTSRSKPDPEVFLMGAAELKLSPKECVVFEDAPKGVQAAKAGGFYCVGVGDEAFLSQADLVVPTLDSEKLLAFGQLLDLQQA
jgi:beta-phosphoglucomutase